MAIIDWFGSHIAWKILEDAAKHSIHRWRPISPSPNWISRLNNKFNSEVRIFCQIEHEPRITIEGDIDLSDAQTLIAERERLRLHRENRPNDRHAIVVGEPNWSSDPPQICARVLDFAAVCALRMEGLKPELLSSSALIVCSEERVLLFHERAKNVATYPGYTHTLGGAYIPPGAGVDDRGGLISTVVREVHEETQIALTGDLPAMIMAKELSTGFIQNVFLGFNISPSTLKRMEGNWEGQPLRVPYDNLLEFMTKGRWVPTGKAHVLAWLALGAPNGGKDPHFGSLTPAKIFDALVGG